MVVCFQNFCNQSRTANVNLYICNMLGPLLLQLTRGEVGRQVKGSVRLTRIELCRVLSRVCQSIPLPRILFYVWVCRACTLLWQLCHQLPAACHSLPCRQRSTSKSCQPAPERWLLCSAGNL